MSTKEHFREMGLTEQEYLKIIEIIGREPNHLETGMFGVMWSEHCGYKSSKPVLKLFPTSGERVVQGPGENAGVVDIGDGQSVVFKIESHNHPSAIEPYQGAATGVGGIVRDIFTMGARPIALLNSLRFGPLEEERSRYLFGGVVAGIGGYGNCLGIPTVAGEVYFHPSYRENCLVNAMCVGLVKTDELARAVAGEVGRPLILVGAKTGRDGIHGATFASEELSEESEAKRPSVQVGDPFMEKLLMEACLELIREDLVAAMQDLGAAGLTSAVAETASRGNRGAEVDVLSVPRREEGMSPYEVMLSESQERMLVIPKEGATGRIQEIFAKWGLDAAVIGRITDDGLFRVKEGEKILAEIPVKALTDMCPVYQREVKKPEYYRRLQGLDLSSIPLPSDYKQVLMKLLASPSIASKEWVYTQYDYQVMTNTVVVPGDGDAAVLRIKGTPKGIAVTVDCNSRMCYLDPRRGGMMAVCEAARNVACVGARPLALTNCLNFGNPEKPEIFWQFTEVVRGMAQAAEALKTPVVSGNVSFYNETKGQEAVFPTPVVGMVGLMDDVATRVTMGFKDEGDIIVLLGALRDELGGSEYLAALHGLEAGKVPKVDLREEARLIELLVTLAARGLLKSCHDVAEGGLAVCLAESAIKGNLGARVDLLSGGRRRDGILFSEAPTRVVVSVAPHQAGEVLKAAQEARIEARVMGEVGGRRLGIRIDSELLLDAEVGELATAWGEAIRCAMRG